MSSKKSKQKNKELMVEDVPNPSRIAKKTESTNIIVFGKNEGQKQAIKTIEDYQVSVIHGVPGSGKTHLAVGVALRSLLVEKSCEKIVFTRPYVEAGENLGFLPGSFNSKIAPFMYPLMDIAGHFIGNDLLLKLIDSGNITVMPLAYMRGVTFKHSFVVADEMQNSTVKQMRMILTRMGENSKLVVTGDTNQSDLNDRYAGGTNGLTDCISRLRDVEEIGFHYMDALACVRSPIVSKIDKLYE